MEPTALEDMTMHQVLANLVEDSRAMMALLITKEGTVIEEAGDTSMLNTTAMAALIAGMFSATREVARMVGEKQFSILLQQGEQRHIHISLVTDSTMMVIVFEDYKIIGRVRLKARQYGEHLIAGLSRQQRNRSEKDEVPVSQFKEYALNLIDQIFTANEK